MMLTDEQILSCLLPNVLNQMTLDQRARAVSVVRAQFTPPEEVYTQVREILRDSSNWTQIVFGDSGE